MLALDGNNEYKMRGEWTANSGSAEGTAPLKGNVAEFIPGETQGCRISLKFTVRRLIVTQSGTDADCGFGRNVYADGSYIKHSIRAPKFEEEK